MPLANLKPVFTDQELPIGGGRVPSPVEAIPGDSPARLLQRRLEMQVAQEPVRWSVRRAAAFIVMSSLALWVALITAASQVMHAIA